MTLDIVQGRSPQKAIDAIAKKMNTSKSNAGRLVMTEEAYFASVAKKDEYEYLGVERYQILATLDDRTSEICQGLDGKVFEMKDYEPGTTAPPFHVRCRSDTIPYFDDNHSVDSKRIARDPETGENYYVPADITYPEWKAKYVDKGLTDVGNGGIIKEKENNLLLGDDLSKMKTIEIEDQRYGRNKNTIVNHSYINDGNYRKKFDLITNDKNINRILYNKAKEILEHRSGTRIEDMYWIDMNTGKIVASALSEQQECSITYSKSILKSIEKEINLITIHNHPSSMPPSIADFNSANVHEYSKGLVICHDGTIYLYISNQFVPKKLYEMYMSEFLEKGYNEKEAQLKTLDKIKNNYDIDYWEV